MFSVLQTGLLMGYLREMASQNFLFYFLRNKFNKSISGENMIHIQNNRTLFFVLTYIAALNTFSTLRSVTTVRDVIIAESEKYMTAYTMQETLYHATVSSSDDSAKDLCHIVDSFNNGKAQYRDGNILLMADTSAFFMSALAIGAIGGLGAGALCLLSAKNSNDAKNQFMLCGAGLVLLGTYSGYNLVRYLTKRMVETPYLTLDTTGILEWGKRVLTWNKLFSIQYRTEFINELHVNKLLLLVKEGDKISTALEISDAAGNDFLPIHQGQFIRLCMKVAKTQQINLTSEPIVEQEKGLMTWDVK